MAVFYSFHFDRDSWRVQQIENMGALDGQPILNAQDWEKVKARGEAASKSGSTKTWLTRARSSS